MITGGCRLKETNSDISVKVCGYWADLLVTLKCCECQHKNRQKRHLYTMTHSVCNSKRDLDLPTWHLSVVTIVKGFIPKS